MATAESATKRNGAAVTSVKLSEALLAAQAEMPSITKDAVNPHFRNKYVSLDSLLATVLPVLNKHGIVLSQSPTYIETITGAISPALTTTLIHAKSGEQFTDTMLLLVGKEDPQGQGAALTYARRYALSSVLGLNSEEDNDGNARQPEPARETPSFQAPSGRKITEGRRKKIIALKDQLVTEGAMKDEHLEAWCVSHGTTFADLKTDLADELEQKLVNLAKNAGVA